MAEPLVAHTLPNGQTIMVPARLAPGGGAWGAGDPMDAAARMQSLQPTPQEQSIAGMRSALSPQAPPAPPEHTSAPSRMQELGALGGRPSAPSPTNLVRMGGGVQQPEPQQDSADAMNPLVRRVFNEGRSGGGGPRTPGGMQVATRKVEIEPGREMLPELKWQMGIEKRPDELREVDPNAAQPTWGDAEPIMRDKLTPLERGAKTVGDATVAQAEQQMDATRVRNIAQKNALVAQSEALDQQLTNIGNKRDRIAELQATADKRAEEARSFEPRSREQVWKQKAAPAQILAILGAALGQYGAILGRSNNAAMEMMNKVLDSAVEDDRAKYERLSRTGVQAKNDLSDAMRVYGDLDLATLDNKQRKLSSILGIIDAQAANRALDQSQQQVLAAIRQQAADQYYAGKQQLFDKLNGHVTKETVDYKNVPASGGGGGDYDTLQKLERTARAQKALDTISGQDKKSKGSPAERAQLNETEAGLVPLQKMLERYKGSDEIPGIADHNIVSRGVRGALDTVMGHGSGSRALDSEEARANRMVFQQAADAYRKRITGAGASEKELARLEEAFAGARTKADVEAIIQITEDQIAAHRRLLETQRSSMEESGVAPGAQAVE